MREVQLQYENTSLSTLASTCCSCRLISNATRQIHKKLHTLSVIVTYASPTFILTINLSNIPRFASSKISEILSDGVRYADSESIKTSCREDSDTGKRMKVLGVVWENVWAFFFGAAAPKDLKRRGLCSNGEQSQPAQSPMRSSSFWAERQQTISKPQGSGMGGLNSK